MNRAGLALQLWARGGWLLAAALCLAGYANLEDGAWATAFGLAWALCVLAALSFTRRPRRPCEPEDNPHA